MKFINKYKSYSFNKRNREKIKYIIIHYTALPSIEHAINHLCNEKNKVSSHYLISQKGDIFRLVSDKERAWHAGQSYWKTNTDLNSISLGIELDYSLKFKNNRFNKSMINSLCKLIKILVARYKIPKENILGHSDIAPYRKKDPGPYFPWKYLVSKNITYNPKKVDNEILIKFRSFLIKKNSPFKKKMAIFMLNYIGYNISMASNQYMYKKLLKAYQMRFLQTSINGRLCDKTYNHIMYNYVNLLLTHKR